MSIESTEIKITDFNKVCRICVKEVESLFEISMFKIIQMLTTCTSIQIDEIDNLPKQICDTCFTTLQNFFIFKQLCEKSDNDLREIATLHKPTFSITYETIEDDLNDEKSECSDFENEESYYVNHENSDSEQSTDSKKDKKLKTTPRHICEICGNRFVKIWHLGLHMKRVHDAKGEKCSKCDIICFHPLHLHLHEKSHIEKKYSCDLCDKTFIQKNHLESHKIAHSTEKPFQCTHCEKFFKRNFILKQHIIHMHSNIQKYVACHICGKSVVKLNLNQHLKIHTERPIISCDQCSKQFYHQQSLAQHIRRVHEHEERVYKHLCNICGQGVASPAELIRHLRSHTGEKPYQCDKCKNKYKTPKALKSHVNAAHLDVRPFSCSLCSRAFHTKNILANHMRTHTGERPFQCVICEKSFGTKSVLKTHMKVHNAEK